MEGIWLGIKYAVLDKGPDDSLMIWQSRPSKDGSNTGGKLRATEKAGAKKMAERAAGQGVEGNWCKNAVLQLHRGKCKELVLVSGRRPLH